MASPIQEEHHLVVGCLEVALGEFSVGGLKDLVTLVGTCVTSDNLSLLVKLILGPSEEESGRVQSCCALIDVGAIDSFINQVIRDIIHWSIKGLFLFGKQA